MSALQAEIVALVRARCDKGELPHVLVEDTWPTGHKPIDEQRHIIRYPKLIRRATAFCSSNPSSKPPEKQRRVLATTEVDYDSAVDGAQGRATEAALLALRDKLHEGDVSTLPPPPMPLEEHPLVLDALAALDDD